MAWFERLSLAISWKTSTSAVSSMVLPSVLSEEAGPAAGVPSSPAPVTDEDMAAAAAAVSAAAAAASGEASGGT